MAQHKFMRTMRTPCGKFQGKFQSDFRNDIRCNEIDIHIYTFASFWLLKQKIRMRNNPSHATIIKFYRMEEKRVKLSI